MAWQLDRVGRHDMEFTCPHCDEVVVSKCGQEMPWHFAHKPGSTCDLAVGGETRDGGETAIHMRAKAQLAQAFTDAGYSVAIEERLGDLRRPDLTVVSPETGRWVTVEVQASPIDVHDMRFRWQHDTEAGATDVLWVWAGRPNVFEPYNVTLPDDVVQYRRITGCSLSLYSRGALFVAAAVPTWWLCEYCSSPGVDGGLAWTQRPTCPGCGLSRPVFYDDAQAAFEVLPSDGRIVVCRGRWGIPVARLSAACSETVFEPVAQPL